MKDICTLFPIMISVVLHKPPREDNLSTDDKWPDPKVSSLLMFYTILICPAYILFSQFFPSRFPLTKTKGHTVKNISHN